MDRADADAERIENDQPAAEHYEDDSDQDSEDDGSEGVGAAADGDSDVELGSTSQQVRAVCSAAK